MTDTADQEKSDRDKWLLLLLLISAADIEAAKQLWLDHAPRGFRGLLTGEGFTYDSQRLVYVTDTGRDVSDRDIKRISILLAVAIAHELQRQAAYVADGSIPIADWQQQAAETIKDLFIVQGALAAGGFDQLTPEVLAVIMGNADAGTGLAFSLDRLRLFGLAIADKAPRADTPDAITLRASLYAETSNAIYEATRRFVAMNAKDDQGRPLFLFEQNVLGDPPTAHCQECPDLTALGWVPIGTLPPPGSRQCAMNCYCSIEYSLTGDLSEGTAVSTLAYDHRDAIIAQLQKLLHHSMDVTKSVGHHATHVAPVTNVHVEPSKPVTRTVSGRDEKGRITEVRETVQE